jgi:hypothetical protein
MTGIPMVSFPQIFRLGSVVRPGNCPSPRHKRRRRGKKQEHQQRDDAGAPRTEEVVGNDMGVAFGELALSAAMTTPSLILMETRTVI